MNPIDTMKIYLNTKIQSYQGDRLKAKGRHCRTENRHEYNKKNKKLSVS